MPYNSTLKAALQAAITTPANPKISGTILQQQLLAMVNAMEAGAVFMGAATPATSPTGEANCFYLALTQGTYTNFLDASGNQITLSAGETAFLSTTWQGNNLRWVKVSIPLPHIDQTTGNWFVGNVDTGVKAQGPQGEDGTNGQDAVNPFKGWFDAVITGEAGSKVITSETTNLPSNPSVGDFAYVKTLDISGTAPSQTETPIVKIYACATAGTWADSGRTFNPAYDQSFASGQQLNEVNIVDNLFSDNSVNVLSAKQGKKLNEGKIDKMEVVSSTTTYTPVPMEDGYPTSGTLTAAGNISSSSYYSIRKYNVVAGSSYRIKALAPANNSMYYFYGADDSKIGGSVGTGSLATVDVVAPQGSSYVLLVGFTSSSVSCDLITTVIVAKNNQDTIDSVGDAKELETNNKTTLVDAINEVHGEVDTLSDNWDEITEVEQPQYINLFDKDSMINGYIDTRTGNIASSSSDYKMSDYIPVQAGKWYYITGRSSNKVIRCLDSNKENPARVIAPNGGTVSTFNLPNENVTGGVVNGQFKIPAGASFVQFNVIFESGDTAGNLMLLEVGDSYDANYQLPSVYVPYTSTPQTKTVVKEDALPSYLNERLDTMQEEIDNISPSAASKKLNVLLVGSSHGVNTISMFPVLCKAAGIDIVCGNLYSGSATIGLPPSSIPNNQIPYKAQKNAEFERFAVYENGSWSTKATKTLKYALETYEWDVIIVQRGNSEVEKWDDTMDGFLQYLLDYIKDNAIKGQDENNHPIYYTPRIYFNSGLANGSSYGSPTQVDTTDNIMSTSEVMKSRWGIDIIPTAVALQYARKTVLHNVGAWVPPYDPPGDKPDLTYDGQHIDTGIGQYVLACCVFEKIIKDFFNMSVRELKYLPVYSDISGNTTNATEAYFTPISEYYSRIGKTCAALACDDMEYKADTATWLNGKFGSQPTQYTITYNLTHCTINNTAATIYDDDVYMGNLTAESGYTLSSSNVQVTMNNEDVKSNVFVTNGTMFGIRIGKVTGNIVITATAN